MKTLSKARKLAKQIRENIPPVERKELEAFIQDIQLASCFDNDFHVYVSKGIEILGLSRKEIVRQFGVSLTTVSRWEKGISAPEPMIRKPIFEWLEDKAVALLNKIKLIEEMKLREVVEVLEELAG